MVHITFGLCLFSIPFRNLQQAPSQPQRVHHMAGLQRPIFRCILLPAVLLDNDEPVARGSDDQEDPSGAQSTRICSKQLNAADNHQCFVVDDSVQAEYVN